MSHQEYSTETGKRKHPTTRKIAMHALQYTKRNRNDEKEEMVGAAGFELATSCTQSRRATRLRYAPTKCDS